MVDCNYCRETESKNKDGICPFVYDNDGYQVRCMGFWAEEKLALLMKYISIFTNSMYKNWSNLVYIDMFAGPGKGIIQENETIIDGSPIISLKQKHNFNQYIFIDINNSNIECLKARIDALKTSSRIDFIADDCNKAIEKIREFASPNSLILTFIDPTSMQVNFNTIRQLSSLYKHIDMIINFPRQAIVRQYKHALKNMGNQNTFDEFFGTDRWRNRLIESNSLTPGGRLLDLYKEQLTSLGFSGVNDTRDSILVRGKKNVPLYELVFASRHPLAYKFFRESVTQNKLGQRRML